MKSHQLSIILLSCILFFVCLTPTISAAERTPKFWISNLDGKRFNSREQKQPYIVSFFFVGCVPCIKEIPELHKLITKEYPDTPLLFIDPLKDDDTSKINEFAEKIGIPTKFFYHDAFGTIGKKFFTGKMKFPTIIGVKNKQMVFQYPGLTTETIEAIKKLLN